MLGPMTFGSANSTASEPTKQILRPISNTGIAQFWTQVNGNGDANWWDELDEGVVDGEGNPVHDGDSTAWLSPPTVNAARYIGANLSPGVDPGTSKGHILRIAVRESDTVGTGNLDRRMQVSQTDPSAQVFLDGFFPVSGTDYEVIERVIPAVEADKITNYAALRAGMESYTQDGTRQMIISAIELELPPPGTGWYDSITDELVGLWGMEESGTSDRLDASGNGLHLPSPNSVATTAGLQGNAAVLTGGSPADRFVHPGHTLFAPSGDWTWMFNVRATTLASEHYILSMGDEQLTFFTDGNRRIRFVYPGGSHISANGLFPLDEWLTVFLCYEQDSGVLYLQYGENITTNTYIRAFCNPFTWNDSQDVHLGVFRPGSIDRGFVGYMDTTAFWHRVLSLDERQWLYNSGAARSVAEILAN